MVSRCLRIKTIYGVGVGLLLLAAFADRVKGENAFTQYIIFNRMPGPTWNQVRPETMQPGGFEEITRHFPSSSGGRIQIGISCIFSYLNTPDRSTLSFLERFLQSARKTNTPILIKLDGESWWNARPDLWNWWDPNRPGYDPRNRENVEWTGWTPDQAIKIAWRNWGRQIRLLPPPNLMSPRYRGACHEKMNLLLGMIKTWWHALPASQKDLLIGINVGWESSIGVNAWYYPHGNDLLDQPERDDPRDGLNTDEVLARGQVQLGYAAVKTAGLRERGKLTEANLVEVVRRHLEDLTRVVAGHGFPREKIFTHGAGWKNDELLYRAAVNRFSCPGWSFYRYADDPCRDLGIRNALKKSEAPYWAAVEWYLMKPPARNVWREALTRTLSCRRCRFLCIYNWESIRNREPVLEAVRDVIAADRFPHRR